MALGDVPAKMSSAQLFSVRQRPEELCDKTTQGKKTAGGLVFGLSNPNFYDARERVELTDFQFGGHISSQLGNNWEASVFVGGGVQDGSTYRHYDNMYFYRGDYRGNTMSATAPLSKVFRVSKRSALRPTIAIDTEHAWFDAYAERSGDNKKKTLLLFGDYNANLFKYATTQIVSLGMQKTY